MRKSFLSYLCIILLSCVLSICIPLGCIGYFFSVNVSQPESNLDPRWNSICCYFLSIRISVFEREGLAPADHVVDANQTLSKSCSLCWRWRCNVTFCLTATLCSCIGQKKRPLGVLCFLNTLFLASSLLGPMAEFTKHNRKTTRKISTRSRNLNLTRKVK